MITEHDIELATPRVLERLRALVELPSEGTVAGQAVASLFYEELGLDIRGPINDVDIFVSLGLDPQERGVVHKNSWHPNKRSNPTARTGQTFVQENTVYDEDYNHVKFICARCNVTILRTYQDGLRNFTLIKHNDQFGGHGHRLNVSQDIVDGFDLNLVQVGINLVESKPVYSEHFLNFLNTKTMQVTTCNTPTHTLIRLTHKAFGGQLENIECNYEREKDLLLTYLQLTQRHATMFNSLGPVSNVGQKYARLALKYPEFLPTLKTLPNNENLFHFNISSTASPHFDDLNALLSKAGSNKNFAFAVNSTFVADFPFVFAVAEQRNGATSAQWQSLQTAVQHNDSAHIVDALSVALHKRPLIYPNVSMPAGNSVLFFQKQKCARDPVKVEEVIQQYNDLNAVERMIVKKNNMKADDFCSFVLHKKTKVTEFLNNNGLHSLIDVGTEAQSREEMDVFFAQFQSWAARRTNVEKIANDVYTDFTDWKFKSQSTEFLKHYCANEKLEKIQRIFEMLPLPLKIKAASSLVHVAHENGVTDPMWWSEHFWFMENPMVHFLRNAHLGESQEQVAFVAQILMRVTDSQLLEDHGLIVRKLLNEQHYGVLKERVALLDSKWHSSGVLTAVCEAQPSSQPWDSEEDIPLNKDLMTKLLLELEMAQISNIEKIRRKI